MFDLNWFFRTPASFFWFVFSVLFVTLAISMRYHNEFKFLSVSSTVSPFQKKIVGLLFVCSCFVGLVATSL